MFLVIAAKRYLSKYEITIFFFLGIQFLALAPRAEDMDILVAASYLFSYRYGISSRSLIATILDFFTRGGFVSRTLVWHFIAGATLLMAFSLSVFVSAAIRGLSRKPKIFAIFLAFLWLSCFTSPAVYFTKFNFGRFEVFALVMLFVAAFAADRPALRWVVPVIALAIVSTHLNLVFFFMPFIGILLLYQALKEKPGSAESRRAWLLLTVTVALALAAFALYLALARRTFAFDDADAFYAHLLERTDLIFSRWAVHIAMFADLEEHLALWRRTVVLTFRGHVSVVISLPIVALFVVFWIKCFLREPEKRMRVFFIAPLAALPYNAIAFFLFFDFGRWLTMSLAVQFMLAFYLLWRGNKTVLAVSNSGARMIRRHAFVIALACLLMAFLGPVTQHMPSENALNFFRLVRSFTGL